MKKDKEETNSDEGCFHDCPLCMCRCNCDTPVCTCCESDDRDQLDTDALGNCFSDADPGL